MKKLMFLLLIVAFIGCKKESVDPKPPDNPNIEYGTVKDSQGNIYKTVRIGNQTWMAENLRVTQFNDGTPIANWNTSSGAEYCVYNDDGAYGNHGLLYNKHAVVNDVCPDGWRIPSNADFAELYSHVNGDTDVLKSVTGWTKPNGNTNSSGFTAMPTGFRYSSGEFAGWGDIAFYWSTTDMWAMYYHSKYFINQPQNLLTGGAIRLVK